MNSKTIRKFAYVYSAMFFAIVALNYIPGIHDESGNMFGLFKLDLIDDVVHLATAIWAVLAAWHSYRQSIIFFKVFGIFYFLDGAICMIFGQCLADFTILTHSHEMSLLSGANFVERFLLNFPHLLIGGAAIYIGFCVSRRITK